MADMPVCMLSEIANFLSNFVNNIKYIWGRFCLNGLLWDVSTVLLKTCLCVCFVTGNTIDRITVYCSSGQELQEWLDNLQPFTKGGSPAGTITKVILKHTHTLQTENGSERETCNTLKCENIALK